MKVNFRAAFTLVEMIVVIAIILILSGLTFVGGRAGIKYARESQCASNLSQIGKAIVLYTDAHDGKFPPDNPNGGIPNDQAAFVSDLLGTSKSRELFYCPLDPHAWKNIVTHLTDHSVMSYSMYMPFAWSAYDIRSGLPKPYLSFIVEPSDMPIMLDVTWLGDSTTKIRVSAHGSSVNVLHADGHVAANTIASLNRQRDFQDPRL